MTPKAQYIRRQIRELQRELEHLGEDERKQYWRDYYRMNRDKKLAAAKERYYAQKGNATSHATMATPAEAVITQ